MKRRVQRRIDQVLLLMAMLRVSISVIDYHLDPPFEGTFEQLNDLLSTMKKEENFHFIIDLADKHAANSSDPRTSSVDAEQRLSRTRWVRVRGRVEGLQWEQGEDRRRPSGVHFGLATSIGALVSSSSPSAQSSCLSTIER